MSALALAACGSPGKGTEEPAVLPFLRALGQSSNPDYEHMASPEDALSTDLVVVGTVTSVVDGIDMRMHDPLMNSRLGGVRSALVVDVERVIAGDPALVRNGEVFIQVFPGGRRPSDEVRQVLPEDLRVAAVLRDWQASWSASALNSSRGDLVRTDDMPAETPILKARPDGLWFQHPDDLTMYGLYTQVDELPDAWGNVSTIDAFVDVIDSAKSS